MDVIPQITPSCGSASTDHVDSVVETGSSEHGERVLEGPVVARGTRYDYNFRPWMRGDKSPVAVVLGDPPRLSFGGIFDLSEVDHVPLYMRDSLGINRPVYGPSRPRDGQI